MTNVSIPRKTAENMIEIFTILYERNRYDYSDFVRELQQAIARAEIAVSEPVAYIRKWAFEKEKPVKERKENGRLAWPFKFKLLPVTKNQCLPDDVPLYATPPAAPLPLSDEQVGEVSYRCADVRGVRVDQFKFARAIEAAHGIVNIGAKE